MREEFIAICLKIAKPVVILQHVALLCFGVYGALTYMQYSYWSFMLSVLFTYGTYQRLKKIINLSVRDAEKHLDEKEKGDI